MESPSVTSQDTNGKYPMGDIFDNSDGGVFIEGTEGVGRRVEAAHAHGILVHYA